MECIQWHPHRITVFPGRFFTKIGKPFYHQNRTVYNHKLQYYTSMTYWFYKKYKKIALCHFIVCDHPYTWSTCDMTRDLRYLMMGIQLELHMTQGHGDTAENGRKRPVDTNMDESIMAGRSFVDLDPNMYIKFESGSRILTQLRSGSKDMLSILKK